MKDTNPLVRALALRTMSYIFVKEFVEATVPLVKGLLVDPDPYVRKTAAFCVAKLYDHNSKLFEGSDLVGRLNSMLRDENPTVVASALASLMDIWERSDTVKLTIDYASASKIIQILPDCSEYVDMSQIDGWTEANNHTDGAKHTFWKLSCNMSRKTPLKLYYLLNVSRHVFHTPTPPLCSLAFVSYFT